MAARCVAAEQAPSSTVQQSSTWEVMASPCSSTAMSGSLKVELRRAIRRSTRSLLPSRAPAASPRMARSVAIAGSLEVSLEQWVVYQRSTNVFFRPCCIYALHLSISPLVPLLRAILSDYPSCIGALLSVVKQCRSVFRSVALVTAAITIYSIISFSKPPLPLSTVRLPRELQGLEWALYQIGHLLGALVKGETATLSCLLRCCASNHLSVHREAEEVRACALNIG